MATSYRTPDVYIEEVSKFPPSVAQVETAIPAFIGATAKARSASSPDVDDLIMTPTRITSLLEYETLFGFAQPERGIAVKVTDTQVNGQLSRSVSVPEVTVKSPYLMYYTMQMYFANGGGPCYIVSTGIYAAWTNPTLPPVISFNDLEDGLETLKKEDEPTLIVFPDAVNLGDEAEMYALYNLALAQCNKMQDRFAIFDTYDDTLASVAEFRNGIMGDKDFAKYGAAYFPHLKTILNYQYNDEDVQVEHITYSPGAISKASTNLVTSTGLLNGKVGTLRTFIPATSMTGIFHDARLAIHHTSGLNLSGTYAHTEAKAEALLEKLDILTSRLDELVAEKKTVNIDAKAARASLEENAGAQTAIDNALGTFNGLFEGANKIEETLKNLKDVIVKAKKVKGDGAAFKKLVDGSGPQPPANNMVTEIAKLLDYGPVLPDYTGTPLGAVTTDVFANIGSSMTTLTNAVSAGVSFDKNNGEFNGRSLSNIIPLDNSAYNLIKQEITKRKVIVPPAGAMAGIYARVDSNNGVWKAPANVSVNFVQELTYKVSSEEQAELNVTTTGKSVNAIRSFTGKGPLVWGARTLAGNDNEWRYISVRRFFNMVEESTKKATEQFVFQANDGNSWVRVRAMIENFLTLQWRAGALAGAKPEQAFYVRVGLGQTMTGEDILNGLMIVEIGMAVVRPAEFIVLRFSHKMQEA